MGGGGGVDRQREERSALLFEGQLRQLGSGRGREREKPPPHDLRDS